jgi:hypothetical protein
MFSPAPDPEACEKILMMAGFLTYPILLQPSRNDQSEQWQWIAGDPGLYRPGDYSSGHCPGFTPGSLLSPPLG